MNQGKVCQDRQWKLVIHSTAAIVLIGLAGFTAFPQSEGPPTERPNSSRSRNEGGTKKAPNEAEQSSSSSAVQNESDGISDEANAEPENETPSMTRGNPWYVAPTAAERRSRYVQSAFGPVAITRYATVAGVLTARNAPQEWGGTWEGFGRRFVSNAAEGIIKQSVRFGLDEALDTDSTFYLSRNRRPIARARNAVFSSVTSRDRNGRRVFGLPKIAGHLTANIASAELWYPQRYTYRHGLKGAAISLAVDMGVNLFREFFWKR
ncbi:MAG TPA: hypothetical protein PKD24_08350 [Pyrinomonadaceae bacterium]|nr:hypothetical protein [Pyrinomonadaceae bacterium]HMP65922.1 hypothetical protein [Pyrinomonadaceae bacterium]